MPRLEFITQAMEDNQMSEIEKKVNKRQARVDSCGLLTEDSLCLQLYSQ